jgi:hypothetical protein
MIFNNKAVIEERANSIVEALRKLPVDSVVYTTVNGLSLNPLDVITEVQGRTSIGCAILDHVNLEMFFKKVFE